MTGADDARRCPSCRAPASDTDRFCRACGTVLAVDEVEHESRKNVVVLFVDLVGATTLAETHDPEVLRRILDRYYRVCAACVAEHLGTVEKYIGDAIMAVFGVPASREDDAVRAVRAGFTAVRLVRGLGAELGLPGVELDAHCGISSGEAVVVTESGADLRIIGDTVNTASRLQTTATAGQVLVNAEVAYLVRRHVRLAEIPPLVLKGKAGRVRAWQVTSLRAPVAPVHRTPMIDRRAEQDRLIVTCRDVVATSTCRLVVVLGAPGLGKSRLVKEFTDHPDVRSSVVVTGRCEPYGKGITYQPVVSIMDRLADELVDLPDLLAYDSRGARALRSLRTLTSGDDSADRPPVGTAEIAWAVTQLFTALAGRCPLIVVWEDLQWAEPSLVELIDDLATWLKDEPVLMVCVARTQPVGVRTNRSDLRIRLTPLDDGDSMLLAHELVTSSAEVSAQLVDRTTERIARGCEGNPLFATMMADAVIEFEPGSELPPTVTAVLRAWFDALPRSERLVLQRAAVCGREFDTESLRLLMSGHDLSAVLSSLLGRGILDRAGPGRYRFAQTLMHETCGAMTAKAKRATWHATLAEALIGGNAKPELAMYHAEAACLLFQEIRPDDRRLPAMRRAAVALLGEHGTRALHRKDLAAAVSLLDRALAVAPPAAPERAALVVRLTDALLAKGESERAAAVSRDEESTLPERDRLALRIQRGIVGLRLGSVGLGTVDAEIAALTARLAERDDDLAWCLLHQFVALLDIARGRIGHAEAELGRALELADRTGDRYSRDRLLGARCELAQWSPTPAGEALRMCDELVLRFDDDRLLLVPVLTTRARLLAMTGDVAAARAALRTASGHATDLHATLAALAVSQMEAVVNAMTGDHRTACAQFTEVAAALRELGHVMPAMTLEVYAVREALHAGRGSTGRLPELGADDRLDHRSRAWIGMLRAKEAGDADAARRTLESITTDDPCLLGDVWFEYAMIAHSLGRRDDVAAAVARSLAHYRAKGATMPAETVRAWAGRAGVASGERT